MSDQQQVGPPDDSITVENTDLLPPYFRQHDQLYITRRLPFQTKEVKIWFQKIPSAEAQLLIEKVDECYSALEKLGYKL